MASRARSRPWRALSIISVQIGVGSLSGVPFVIALDPELAKLLAILGFGSIPFTVAWWFGPSIREFWRKHWRRKAREIKELYSAVEGLKSGADEFRDDQKRQLDQIRTELEGLRVVQAEAPGDLEEFTSDGLSWEVTSEEDEKGRFLLYIRQTGSELPQPLLIRVRSSADLQSGFGYFYANGNSTGTTRQGEQLLAVVEGREARFELRAPKLHSPAMLSLMLQGTAGATVERVERRVS